jgi:hypothetical protein
MNAMWKTVVTVAAVAMLVAACASPDSRPPVPEGRWPADFPGELYRQALAQGKPVFRVDPGPSLVVIEVRRGGSLARLGHDHVVASHDVGGYVSPSDGRSDLYVRLDRLVVDEPGLRADAGFDTQPSADDIAGTRQNMLQKVLQADRYPYALISVRGVDPVAAGAGMRVAITLHGTTRAIEVPARIETRSDAIDVSGRLALEQTDFEITPFAILGGALQVQNQVNLRFRIHARRIALDEIP